MLLRNLTTPSVENKIMYQKLFIFFFLFIFAFEKNDNDTITLYRILFVDDNGGSH